MLVDPEVQSIAQARTKLTLSVVIHAHEPVFRVYGFRIDRLPVRILAAAAFTWLGSVALGRMYGASTQGDDDGTPAPAPHPPNDDPPRPPSADDDGAPGGEAIGLAVATARQLLFALASRHAGMEDHGARPEW